MSGKHLIFIFLIFNFYRFSNSLIIYISLGLSFTRHNKRRKWKRVKEMKRWWIERIRGRGMMGESEDGRMRGKEEEMKGILTLSIHIWIGIWATNTRIGLEVICCLYWLKSQYLPIWICWGQYRYIYYIHCILTTY